MKIHEIPYVPQVEPARPSGDRSKSFEEELRKRMRLTAEENTVDHVNKLEKELRECLK